MALYNESDYIGQLIIGMSNNVTGSETMTLFIIVMCMVLLMFIFRLPTELIVVFSLPLLIVLSLYSGFFSGMLAVVILLLGFAIYYYLFQ